MLGDKEFYDCIFSQASFSEGFSNLLEAFARGSVTCVSKQCNMASMSSDGLLSEFDIETNELDALLADIHSNLSHYEESAKAASEKVLEMYSAEKLACRLETQLRGI